MLTEPMEVHEEGENPFVTGPETSCCISALMVVR